MTLFTDGLICPKHENSSLQACADAGCWYARLTAESLALHSVLELVVEAHENNKTRELAAMVHHARAVLERAIPPKSQALTAGAKQQ